MMVNFLSWLFEDHSKARFSPRDVYSKKGQCLLRDRVLTKCILGDSFCFEVSGRRPRKSGDFPVAGGGDGTGHQPLELGPAALSWCLQILDVTGWMCMAQAFVSCSRLGVFGKDSCLLPGCSRGVSRTRGCVSGPGSVSVQVMVDAQDFIAELMRRT